MSAWQRVGDRDDALTDAIAQRDAARDEVTSLSDRVEALVGRLAAADTRAAELAGEISAVQEELLAMLGRAVGRKALRRPVRGGSYAEAPRLVIDIEQWFTDQAAFDAAEEDGVFLDHPYSSGTKTRAGG